MRKILILLTCIYSYNIAFTQLPNTNIYLFQMEQQSDSLFNFVNPKFLTEFNSDGYNNDYFAISNTTREYYRPSTGYNFQKTFVVFSNMEVVFSFKIWFAINKICFLN